MKKIIYLIGLLIASQVCEAQEKQEAEHVILISVDGFRPDFYLEEKWPAPNLKKMVKEGVSATGVRGIFPSVTYPSHTTLITGATQKNTAFTTTVHLKKKGRQVVGIGRITLLKQKHFGQPLKKLTKQVLVFFGPFL